MLQNYQSLWKQLVDRDISSVTRIQQTQNSNTIISPEQDSLLAVKLPIATINISRNPLPPSWNEVWQQARPILETLEGLYLRGQQEGFKIFPTPKELFNAYWQTPLYATDPQKPWQRVRVVIIGQDPYPQFDSLLNRPRAMGMCFSCPNLPDEELANYGDMAQNAITAMYNKANKSLQNIFAEIKAEYPNFNVNRSVNLSDWARQGILLLNYSLVVKENDPAGKDTLQLCSGLFKLTIEAILKHNRNTLWVLWGAKSRNAAKKHLQKVSEKHLLYSAHPSPLSAHKGFLGNGHFRKINELLQAQGEPEIIW